MTEGEGKKRDEGEDSEGPMVENLNRKPASYPVVGPVLLTMVLTFDYIEKNKYKK